MRARYDEVEVPITPQFVEAAVALMRAHCEMMRQADPRNADCWVAGRCEIHRLSEAGGIRFFYGLAEGFDDGLDDFAVVVVEDECRRKDGKRQDRG